MKMRLSVIPYSEHQRLIAEGKSGRNLVSHITRNIAPRDFGGGKSILIGKTKFYVYDMWPASTSGGL